MVLTAEATVRVDAEPQQVLEFVLDVDRYRQADHKILRVVKVVGPDEAGRGSVRLWGRLRGTPPLPDVQEFHLDRWRSLTFTGAPRQPGRLVFGFTGIFVAEPDGDGCLVTHAYEFRFRRPFRFLERALATWLQKAIEDEVQLVKELVEMSNGGDV